MAKQLGYVFIDSGAMYRAVTLKVLRQHVDPNNESEGKKKGVVACLECVCCRGWEGPHFTPFVTVARIAKDIQIVLKPHPDRTCIFVDGEDVSSAIRTEEIAKSISPVARNPVVRSELVARQQEMGTQGGVVMDGRDIGTVVFPNAQLKVFMTASAAERARRRVGEYEKAGTTPIPPFEEILKDIEQRDAADRSREVGPLKMADDAVLIETDGMSIQQQVDRVIELVREREAKKAKTHQ